MNDRKTKPEETYVALRSSFWLKFYAMVLLATGMASVTAVLTVYKIINPGFWSGSAWPWILLALSSVFFILIAAFSGRLIITWAQLLRYARYQEERARTVIAAKDITVYAENEERRDKELKSEVKDMGTKLQESVHEAIKASSESTEKMVRSSIQGMNDQMYDLIRNLSERMEKIERISAAPPITAAAIAAEAIMRSQPLLQERAVRESYSEGLSESHEEEKPKEDARVAMPAEEPQKTVQEAPKEAPKMPISPPSRDYGIREKKAEAMPDTDTADDDEGIEEPDDSSFREDTAGENAGFDDPFFDATEGFQEEKKGRTEPDDGTGFSLEDGAEEESGDDSDDEDDDDGGAAGAEEDPMRV